MITFQKLKKVIFQQFIMWSVSGHYTTKYHQLNWDTFIYISRVMKLTILELTETFILDG